MKQRKKFTHNKCIYACTTKQKVGDSNYDKAVKIHYLGSVILGWNATEKMVEDVQPTEEIERHARLIENADAMYSALQAVNTCMTLDTPLAIETHKRILELLHKIDNK